MIWLTTAPNPRSRATGFDAGQRGWKLHAMPPGGGDTFKALGRKAALCGLRPAHGSMDMFIEDKCARCLRALEGTK